MGDNGKTCKALFDFAARKAEELSLTKGETVRNVKAVNKDWWKGVNSSGKSGVFPATYVVVVDASAAKKRVIARHDYDGKSSSNKLSLRKGDKIKVLAEVSADWWSGMNERGETGLFPANYVTEDPRSSTSKSLQTHTSPSQPQQNAMSASEVAQLKEKSAFTSATLKDFPITFAMPRKNIPYCGSKYTMEESAQGREARGEAKNLLKQLNSIV